MAAGGLLASHSADLAICRGRRAVRHVGLFVLGMTGCSKGRCNISSSVDEVGGMVKSVFDELGQQKAETDGNSGYCQGTLSERAQ